ncbi:MAG: ERCC4 domain-containing protein [bacterium]
MTIVQDTREKTNKKEHILSWFKLKKINVVRSKMFVGDYTYLHNQTICVDSKFSLLEVAQNVTKDHERFKNECIRARDNGIQLVILIECEEVDKLENLHKYKMPTYKSTGFKKVNGKSVMTHYKGQPMSRMNPETLQKALMTMQDKYGIKVMFAKRLKFGEMIIRILNREFE